MFSDPFVLALRLARTFDALSIPYLIGGSVATSIHGELRTTQDIDFVAHFRESQIVPLVESLRQEFYVDDEMIRSALLHHSSFNVIYLESMDKPISFSRGKTNGCARRWLAGARYAWIRTTRLQPPPSQAPKMQCCTISSGIATAEVFLTGNGGMC